MTACNEMDVALRPLRETILRRARADADRTLAGAQADAVRVLGGAEHAAAAIREEARARGEAEGAQIAAAERARARRLVRAAELSARAQVYARLRERVTATLRELCDEPEYPLLRKKLAAEAYRMLGSDAVVEDAPAGGVLAEGEAARADLSLDGFAARAVAALGPELEGLWAS
ncbi:hypothetical protein [Nocardia higoensis]|uniref:hypothetical protein n=1 Tax=Nocardia higoensis TaxID=228599 RepID=UPI0005949948|nr:hypothetical protein [Nocardia higoensis]